MIIFLDCETLTDALHTIFEPEVQALDSHPVCPGLADKVLSNPIPTPAPNKTIDCPANVPTFVAYKELIITSCDIAPVRVAPCPVPPVTDIRSVPG